MITETLKGLFRRYIYVGPRYAPDAESDGLLHAVRLDNGSYPVIYSPTAEQAPLGAANYVGRHLKRAPALFLLWFSWSARSPKAVRRTAKAIAVYRSRRPNRSRLRKTIMRATDGKVELPADLSDRTYRFLTDLSLWRPASTLKSTLRIRS